MTTPGQLSFPGLEPESPRPRLDRLFFAIFPDAETAARIADLAARLRDAHRLSGKLLRTDRFHITVNHLDDFPGVPERIVAAASQAAASVKAAPFEVVFDRAASFKGKPDKKPFVLRGGDALEALIAFQQALGFEMAKAGLGDYVEKSFTPHVTLLYDPRLVPEEPVEPIRWTVRELVLIHSLLGQTRHIPLGRWPLGG
jgi:2'-5' RNA ligase